LNISLNLALAPSRGAEGAGIALICTEVASAVAAGIWLRRVARYTTPLRFAARLLLPVVLTIAALWAARNEPLWVRILLLGCVYAAGVLVAGPVRLDELRELLGRDRKIPAAAAVEEGDVS
jgi:O-antigen/teichoic acid export membrane protein